jgi:hypothetical protein
LKLAEETAITGANGSATYTNSGCSHAISLRLLTRDLANIFSLKDIVPS